MSTATTFEAVTAHILKQLEGHKGPLFVAIQGPQGSGKTYLSAQIREYLTSEPHNLRVALLSIDDLYLPHTQLLELAASQPHNSLWQGRGQPGTHDVALGISVLAALRDGIQNVELPRFDKSLFGGHGDRLPMDGSGVIIEQPPAVDVVILEGWCVGFYPITQKELDRLWDGTWRVERERLGLPGDTLCSKRDVESANNALVQYGHLWSFFDTFIRIRPSSFDSENDPLSIYSIVYQWRLEQEHSMKAKNGGRGMSDEAVKGFVDRYIPGYVFFGDTSPEHTSIAPPRWLGKSLTVVIEDQRTFLKAVEF
ncbi:hypothetical protein D9756_005452 [Leucocoprinus leucothites]|uniref:P-loop containing nucleoside triphosphate hydrolase protein n=1 Tax=Leucocoprinus leucothites TaxID=201217 RepID=A0A8H5DA99_9AGAR|nr:hypothetical protein D9756_005452 [Leucoagaricus leucothites]